VVLAASINSLDHGLRVGAIVGPDGNWIAVVRKDGRREGDGMQVGTLRCCLRVNETRETGDSATHRR